MLLVVRRCAVSARPLSDCSFGVNLMMFLDGDRFWLTQQILSYLAERRLWHRILVKALLKEHLLLRQGISVDDYVILSTQLVNVLALLLESTLS